MSLTTTIPLKLGTTQVSRFVSGEGVGLAWGGTGQDLSASGGATFVLAQDASHVISARALIAADIPSLDAAKITTGLIGLARGGTNADLSTTGGTSKFLRQASAGAAITVVQPTLADMAAGTATVDLVTTQKITSTYVGSGGRTGNISAVKYFNSLLWGHTNTEYLCSIGANNSNGHPFIDFYCYHSTTSNTHARASATIIPVQVKCDISGNLGIYHGNTGTVDGDITMTEKYRLGPTMLETNRISLGGTFGSSVDPGSGNLACGWAKAEAYMARTANSLTYLFGSNDSSGVSTGAYIYVSSNAHGTPGSIGLLPGNVAGSKVYLYDKNAAIKLQIDEDGVYVMNGPLRFNTGTSILGSASLTICGEGGTGGTATTGSLALCSGHAYNYTYGAVMALYGNTSGAPGQMQMYCGAVAGGALRFFDRYAAQQMYINESGVQMSGNYMRGVTNLYVYATDSANTGSLFLGGGSQATGWTTSGGALIHLNGAGGTGHALYYLGLTTGARHYFYDKNATAQVSINESGLWVYGAFGMNGVTPVGIQSVSAAATDLATVLTLCNGIRTALIAFGLVA